MSEVTAAMVKELRGLTGAGMADCKKALIESGCSIEDARSWLMARGTAIAERKSSRSANEGLITASVDGKRGVLVEILAETDFVTSNDLFREFAQSVADALLASDQAEILGEVKVGDTTVEELRTEKMLQIGENIQLGKHRILEAQGSLAHYVHHNGKIGVLSDTEGLDETQSRQLCMHIASMKPKYLTRDDCDTGEIERYRSSFAEAVADSGKPAEVQEKIIAGKLNKVLAESTLLMQEYVWEDGLSVEKFLSQHNAGVSAFELLNLES